ncbi:uncharacterized protein JCM6883_007223 [Sporobolomyces salmoneus]|uniref:uncharacterized protein n=1 Tax=Sporobolomyces salmoneus TaxID=183962 RepID=UPI00316B85E2
MVALTAKNLQLPHLSLSRTSSPSRSNSNSSNPSTPTTTTTTISTAPTSPAPASTTSSSFFGALDRKKSKSNSPKHRPLNDQHLTPIDPLPSTTSTTQSPESTIASLQPEKPQAPQDKRRSSSFGASLSGAFSSSSSNGHGGNGGGGLTSRSSSQTGQKSSTLPAGLSLTPASAHLAHQEGEPVVNVSGGGGGGFKPFSAAIAKSAGVVKDRSGALLMRSKSSDRSLDYPVVSHNVAEGVTTTNKKKGVMGTVRGLALGQSVSQPAQSRSSSVNANGGLSIPVRSSSVHSTLLPHSHSGSTTPTSLDPTSRSSTPALTSQVHQLAESHVSQISLRMSETVNKVFMPSAHGTVGQQQDKLEGCFFVPSNAVQEATGGKGRPCPRVVKSREFGQMILTELHAALHDPYLLRTILRSSVLKALSLFLSRLSALLLVPTSPTDPTFNPPLSISSAKDPKSQESDSHFASQFPLALRYNLHIVRCALTVKQHLLELATHRGGGGGGFPGFVEETLRPWRGKLTELIGRVMNPLVAQYKVAVVEACRQGRIEGGFQSATEREKEGKESMSSSSRGRANSGERSSSSLGLSGVPRSGSQGRSLSLGRPSSITPLPSTVPVNNGGGTIPETAGPTWLQEVTTIFEVCSRLFARLEAKQDTDRWAVGIAISATWKGMLACSARIISEDGIVPSSTTSTGVNSQVVSTPTVAAPVKNRLLGGVKKTPSPPPSPPLPAVHLTTPGSTAQSPSSATVAFVRLISDLELFEHRLTKFLTSTLSSPSVVFHPSASPIDECPGAPSCGLCKTGRTFDEESDTSSDEDGGGGDQGIPGKESRLALSAMREAMQALSSMIVVVRASRDLKVLQQALRSDVHSTLPTSTSSNSTTTNAPLTPSDLFALGPAKPPQASTSIPASSTSVTVVSPSPAHPHCPTLRAAIIDLHPLILLHLILSRLPRSLPFRLPHEIWALRDGWNEYESELRGFAAGEEWAGEVAWEVKGELVRVKQELEGEGGRGSSETEKRAVEVLEETVERVSRDSA